MKVLSSHDVVYVPADQGTCSACGGGLFAVVNLYLADTGEPVENGIHVGCTDCEAEISGVTVATVRQWVCSNYRVKV